MSPTGITFPTGRFTRPGGGLGQAGGGPAVDAIDYFLAKNFSPGTGIVGSLGNHTAADPVSSRTPKKIDPGDVNFLYLPGITGNTVLSSSIVGPTGDFEVRAAVALTDWEDGTFQEIVAQWNGVTPSDEAWILGVRDTGFLRLVWRNNAGTALQESSTVKPPATNEEILLVRGKLDVDNGAEGYEVTFYTKPFIADVAAELASDVDWTQLGDVIVGGSTTTVQSVTRQIDLMGSAGLGRFTEGKLYGALVTKDGGTVMADPDLTELTSPYESFSDPQGNTWTINRAANGPKCVYATSDVGPVLLHAADYLEIADHEDFDFGAADSFTVIAVLRIYGSKSFRQAVVSKSSLNQSSWIMIEASSTSDWLTFAHDGSGSDFDFGPGRTSGQVHALAMRVDRSVEELEAFLDGTGSGTPDDTTSRGSLANANPVRIGMNVVSPEGEQVDGEFIAVGFYPLAMTAGQIAAEGTRLLEENAA